MIGDIVRVDKSYYLQTNTGGTLEVLPRIKWYKRFWILVLVGLGRVSSVHEVRNVWR